MNKLKIFKTVTYMSLGAYLLFSAISLYQFNLFASYITGYSVDSIVSYGTGNFNSAIICKEFFPEKVAGAIGDLYFICFMLFIVSFFMTVAFIILARKSLKNNNITKSELKNTVRNFLVVFVISFLMSFISWMNEPEYHYIRGCDQIHQECDYVRENPENSEGKSIEELHARGEYLYCD